VSVWASESGLTLDQVATDDKSNEISAIPRVLSRVDLNKSIVTIDAMGTQTAIAKQIVDGHCDYVLALKRDQGTLFEAATD
jgi:predicted transposase YbfD/YdcC